jgi:hypothetical protein
VTHAFISYVRENTKQIDKLAANLRSQGIDVWLDRDAVRPGIYWKDAIKDAIQEGGHFVACFSQSYHRRKKTFMNEEILTAIDILRQYSFGQVWFIPVLLEECNVPAVSIGAGRTLLDIQWISLYENWEEGIDKIARALKPLERKEMRTEIIGCLIDIERIARLRKRAEQPFHLDHEGTVSSLEDGPGRHIYEHLGRLISIYQKRFKEDCTLDEVELRVIDHVAHKRLLMSQKRTFVRHNRA